MKKYNFWYSEKQKEIGISLGESGYNKVKIGGKTFKYTECSVKKKPSGSWDDYKYIGSSDIVNITVIK